tara:strand:- start:621 stop:923 length:303 start_codon:yes stop_codon:yes gene_type:complete
MIMDVKDYLWYPYLRYQAECREQGKEDSIQEWLELTGKVEAPAPKIVEKKVKKVIKPRRARNGKGHYVADDPSTPENEAWVDGTAPKPKRKRGRPRKKVV